MTSGDLIAAFNFGVCLAEGVGIERDDQKAAQWLRRAADGVVNAQYWYGRMLVEGRGVEKNAEEGRAWITRAADIGMIEAQVMLADMQLNGTGGPKDHAAALVLFTKAAEAGHLGAMFAHRFDKAGVYYLRVSDYQRSGRTSHFYRIVAGEFPLINVVVTFVAVGLAERWWRARRAARTQAVPELPTRAT